MVAQNSTFDPNPTLKDDLKRVAKQKQWPTAYIFRVEPSGLMVVKFKQKMKVPDHPGLIQNETVTIDD